MPSGTTVSLKEISERQQLSLKYLEQIVTPLARKVWSKASRAARAATGSPSLPTSIYRRGDPAHHRGAA